MRSQRSRQARRVFTTAAPILLVPLLLGSASQTTRRSAPIQAIPGISDRASLLYADAASAVRGKDCVTAFKILAPLTGSKGPEAAFAQLLSGFYAHACEQVALAEQRLYTAADPDGTLEDWRLYILSDAAVAQGHVLVAQNALARLLGDYPGSVLRPRALVKAAGLAWQRADARRALELIDEGRREGLGGEDGSQLERLAWDIGSRLSVGGGGDGVRQEAARRLLSDWPSAAAELQAAEIFRRADGLLDWPSILSPDQMARRARALLALRLDPSAAATLDTVPVASRDLGWYLLRAQTLTRTHQGAEALTLLSPRVAQGAQAAALEWERALAAEDVATAWRGRNNLPAAERQRMREESRQCLVRILRNGADRDLSVQALRALYAGQVDDGLFDEAVESLRQLKKLNPADTTGAANLWETGWREFGKRNYTGAVGIWTELFALYPRDSSGRRGRYWTARAFEALGENERAQQIYREVAASDTTDFYRKNALARLQGKPAAGSPSEVASEPWPVDPTLARARLLTDLGLDDLADSELELVRAKAQPQPALALEALILARKGERRKSILVIRDAFPALGGAFQAGLPEDAWRLYYPVEYQESIRNWATMNRLPSSLVLGMIRQESAFDTNAQSGAGARGLMQLMPATAKELARKVGIPFSHDSLSDPEFNVRLGTMYFSRVLDMFDGNVDLALAGYNGGPYRMKRWWREWGSSDVDRFLESLSLEEPRVYVKRILVLSDSYRQLYPLPG